MCTLVILNGQCRLEETVQTIYMNSSLCASSWHQVMNSIVTDIDSLL